MRRSIVATGAAAALLCALTLPAAAHPDAETITVRNAGFKTPESVIHDTKRDRYFVSNVGGPSARDELAKDDDGFISRLTIDGTGVEPRWIDGRSANVTLNSPHGMGLFGNTLFVADLDTVRKFDRFTGAPLGEIKVPGSTFLNDLTIRGSVIYVTDTGLAAGADGVSYVDADPRSDAVFEITDILRGGVVSAISAGPGLAHPNGVAFERGALRVSAYDTSGSVYTPGPGDTQRDVVTFPAGFLDGLVEVRGALYASSGEDAVVYKRERSGEFTKFYSGVITEQENTLVADMGVDRRRERLLMPLYYADEVIIQPLG